MRWRSLLLVLLVTAGAACEPVPPFRGEVLPIDAATRADMTGRSWQEGCPVGLDDLRLLRFDHWGFDGQKKAAELVVHADVAAQVLGVFEEIWESRFQIEQIRRVDAYDGDDDRSMAANNTSAFNCRRVAGTSRWSEHAYGRAVDVNPVQNPYVRGDSVEPPAGRAYTDRSRRDQGMLAPDGPVVRAFERIGWGWGGRWSSSKDYQHLSQSGR